jgi:hypothetical protein
MDNKQNREFYWEVKDFLGKKPQLNESVNKKPDSLKDSIKKMLVQGNVLHQPILPNKQIVNELLSLSENTIRNVANFIEDSEVEVNKGRTDSKAFTSNITENLFSLQKKSLLAEQYGGLGGGGGGRPTAFYADNDEDERRLRFKRKQDAIDRRIEQNQEEAEARRLRVAELARQRQVDREAEAEKELGSLSSDPDERRRQMKAWGTEKANQRQAEAISSEIDRLSGMSPESMTDSDKAKLRMLQIQMQDAKTKERVSGSLATKAETGGQYGPSPTGDNISFEPGRSKISSVMGVDPSSLNVVKSNIPDTKISGTSMTRSQFKTMTGREYNAFDKQDQNLVRGIASRFKEGRFVGQPYGASQPLSDTARSFMSSRPIEPLATPSIEDTARELGIGMSDLLRRSPYARKIYGTTPKPRPTY